MENINLGLNHDNDLNHPTTTFTSCFGNQLCNSITHNKTCTKCFILNKIDFKLTLEHKNAKPRKVVCGGNHSFILFDTGLLFACGDNNEGQCGICSPSSTVLKTWTFIRDDVLDITCGWEFTVIATLLNNSCESSTIDIVNNTTKKICIKSCGVGLKGELGYGMEIKKSKKLNRDWLDVMEINVHPENYKNSIQTIIKLYGSLNNVLVYDGINDVWYGWGANRKNQLLVDNTGAKNLYKPTVLETLSINRGNDKIDIDANDLTYKLDHLVSMGKDFICLIKSENMANVNNLILQGTMLQNYGEKMKNTLKENINSSKDVIVYNRSMWSSLHLIVCKKNNAASSYHQLLSIGNGNHGQLSLNGRLFLNQNNVITKFEVGSEHGIIVVRDLSAALPSSPPSPQDSTNTSCATIINKNVEKVYCFGWGEHGNCGPIQKKDKNNDIMDDLNLVYETPKLSMSKKESIEFVSGGCATTWICIFSQYN
ncbi:Ats1p SCDLUD_000481 [Saccharomycodes ludwigii]|uniref:Ats1p n=1 Tax=Saccharomycodes ludwigii TaxID=36035 RepID=UPI001E8B2F29|nr:hypothetical protein SCDLUD_000481 [Saccharomycodes ludwigii]KAH3902886.1 hypothetical protein SCDLUD_000481 [Saccharomycodes ludwigii]